MDFYKELYSQLSTSENSNYENICLISQEPLEKNHITLYCNHSFNYLPLFYEVNNQMKTNWKKMFTIQCPYCRKLTNGVLPYLPEIKDIKIIGVNSPESKCFKTNRCEYVIKSGKNKNNSCKKKCFHKYCKIHLSIVEKMKHKKDISSENNKRCIAKLVSNIQCKYNGKINITNDLHTIMSNESKKELHTKTVIDDTNFNNEIQYYVCGIHKNILHSIKDKI